MIHILKNDYLLQIILHYLFMRFTGDIIIFVLNLCEIYKL